MTSRKKVRGLKITAVLKRWRLSKNVASGIISNSKTSYLPNGMFYLVNIDVITHFDPKEFPRMDMPENWLIRDIHGKYFRIFIGDRWTNDSGT